MALVHHYRDTEISVPRTPKADQPNLPRSLPKIGLAGKLRIGGPWSRGGWYGCSQDQEAIMDGQGKRFRDWDALAWRQEIVSPETVLPEDDLEFFHRRCGVCRPHHCSSRPAPWTSTPIRTPPIRWRTCGPCPRQEGWPEGSDRQLACTACRTGRAILSLLAAYRIIMTPLTSTRTARLYDRPERAP